MPRWGAGTRGGITIEGLDQFLRRLRSDELNIAVWRDALSRAAEAVLVETRRDSPHATGKLEAKLTKTMSAGAVPTWAKVRTTASNRGFAYPGALEGGNKYHYRSTAKQGQQTHHWMRKALEKTQDDVNRILTDTVKRIERAWSG